MRHPRLYHVLAILLLTSLASSAQYRYRYWFDTPADVESAVYGDSPSSTVALDIDVSGLYHSIHTFSFQIADDDNGWGDVRTSIFVHSTPPANMDMKTVTVFIDGNEHQVIQVSAVQDVRSIDISSMPEGLHVVTAILEDSNGCRYPSGGVLCYRNTSEDPKITGYRYWLNDDDQTAQYISVNPAEQHLRLKTMLELPGMPLSSKNFACCPTDDGELDLHPVNTFNWLTFCGTESNGSFGSQEYTDICTTVHVDKDAIGVLPNACQELTVFEKANDNSIAWKQLYAGADSHLTLHGNTSCSIDMFDSKGNKVWTLGGDDIKNDTTYVFPETGLYYIGVHDADTKDVELTYSLMNNIQIGDADCNGTVDYADVNAMCRYYLGLPADVDLNNADIILDGTIDSQDIVAVNNLCVSGLPGSAAIIRPTPSEALHIRPVFPERIIADGKTVNEIKFYMHDDNATGFCAFNMELVLPTDFRIISSTEPESNNGLAATAGSDNTTHSITCNLYEDSHLRIICNSENNALFKESDSELFTLKFIVDGITPAGIYSIMLEGVKFCNTKAEAHVPAGSGVTYEVTVNNDPHSDIRNPEINNNNETRDEYDLSGHRITPDNQHGIVISKDRKVLLK